MSFIGGLRRFLLGLTCSLAALLVLAEEPCRVAFDMGSSGIRAGATGSNMTVQADEDFLALLRKQPGLQEFTDRTIGHLQQLMMQGGFDARCQRVGGGFSAWRLALKKDAAGLANALARIHSATGVAILVLPQSQEGAYAYFGVRELLGARFVTTHVLDIGGGSLQVAGERSAFGDLLGQKLWHRELCRGLRYAAISPCDLQAMSGRELRKARHMTAARLSPVSMHLPAGISLTAVSRPVTRGVLPAVKAVTGEQGSADGFELGQIERAIDRLSRLSTGEITVLTGIKPPYVAYLLSDMLLVEGIMRRIGTDYLHVAEISLTNIPGLLTDDRAYRWGDNFDCYLRRMQTDGASAYADDPSDCQ